MREMHSKRPKFSKFSGGACPRTPLEARALRCSLKTPSASFNISPPTSQILPSTPFLIENPDTNRTLWNGSKISVDKGTSRGLKIGNVGIRKLTHRYTNSRGITATIYYHRIIVNFRKLISIGSFFLHILVDIPLVGSLRPTFPYKFSGVYMIAYGIVGTFSNIDPDKVYDYHTAFDIKPTEVVYNVE